MGDLMQAAATAFRRAGRADPEAGGADIRALTEALAALLRSVRARPSMAPVAPAGSYRRVLLLEDEARGYSVWAFSWGPGAASPVHGHPCWCLLGTAFGTLSETRLGPPAPGGAAEVVDEVTLGPGSVAYHAPGDEDTHRIANATDRLAISVHVYGVTRRAALPGMRWVMDGAPG